MLYVPQFHSWISARFIGLLYSFVVFPKTYLDEYCSHQMHLKLINYYIKIGRRNR